MEQMVVMSDQVKRRIGVLCVIPSIVFFITLGYYLFILYPLTQGHPAPESVLNITVKNYTTLFIMLAGYSVISSAVLIYCIVHLVKLESLNRPKKMLWILFLLVVPMSYIYFWYKVIKSEPQFMEVNSDIG